MTSYLKKIGQSQWFDYVGVALVVFVAYNAGYLFSKLNSVALFHNVAWASLVPFGIISAVSAVLSILSTRYVAKLNYLGNVIGTVNVVLAGVIDYLLGNQGAILTYPLSFVINILAVFVWHKLGNKQLKATRVQIVGLFVVGLLISFGLNALMFKEFNTLYYLSSTVFGLSLTANVLNVFKINSQWSFWAGYNVIQLVKAVTQGNFANVGKYVYYIINSIMAHLIWRDENNTK